MFQEIEIETMHKKDSYFQKPEKVHQLFTGVE